MDTKKQILDKLNESESLTGRELCKILDISRQALNKHIQTLIETGKIVKHGRTRGAVYRLGTKPKGNAVDKLCRIINLSGAHEDQVFDDFNVILNTKKMLDKNIYDILYYSFTEMLNNAIDHSSSEKCNISISLDMYKIRFIIRDNGIGIFSSIHKKFGLPDENSAIGELIKGKTTTMKERHSGEGIFFTSKLGDIVSFRSHGLKIVFDNVRKDVFVQKKRFIAGTEVDFEINRHSKRKIDKCFHQFAPEEFDYKFDRTSILVKLFHKDYVSRSEAKRLVSGLDKFKEVILDFKDVDSMGQGFADELFRVFMSGHPEIKVHVRNAGDPVKIILSHVVDNDINDRLTIG
jgi:biotin operon repressor/anti-sigma regulatory factor (Ser/Thr protein kinase)